MFSLALFEVALAMFGYMTDLDTVEELTSEDITAQGRPSDPSAKCLTTPLLMLCPGDDLESLLFHFLDEFLFTFSADPFFIPKVWRKHTVTTL